MRDQIFPGVIHGVEVGHAADFAIDGHACARVAAIPEALTDTVAGRVQFFMPSLSPVTTFIKDGRLLALGVSTQARVAGFPDIPTIAESGVPGYQWNAWTALLAPAKTPRSIINQLHREISRILSLPEIHLRMAAIGAEVAPISPEQLDKMIAAEIALTTQLARKNPGSRRISFASMRSLDAGDGEGRNSYNIVTIPV